MKGAVPISDWRLSNGVKIREKDEKTTSGAVFVAILSNKSYPFVSRSTAFDIVNVSTWEYPVAAPTAVLPHQRRKRSMSRPSKEYIQLDVGEVDVDSSGGQDSSNGWSSTFMIAGGSFAMMLLVFLQCTLLRSLPSTTSHRSPYHQR